MPIYGYECEACGPFSEMQRMSRSSEPMPCPDCGKSAPRSISAPFIANMDPNNRIAYQRNEKSAHEPKVKSGMAGGHSHSHSNGRIRGLGDGLHHAHKHGRPWSVGH